VLEPVFAALNNAQVKYLIVGGLAIHAYGYERLTRDVDMVMGLDPGNIIRGLRALLDIGYGMPIPATPEEFADAGQRESWRREKTMIVLKLWSDEHRRTPVDVLFMNHSILQVNTGERNGIPWRLIFKYR
jgi:hypothetical protein